MGAIYCAKLRSKYRSITIFWQENSVTFDCNPLIISGKIAANLSQLQMIGNHHIANTFKLKMTK